MKYKLELLFLILLLISLISVSAEIARECLDRVKPNMNCSVISSAGTPCTGGSGFIIIDATDGSGTRLRNGTVLTLDSTYGICYTTFNQSGSGDYLVVFNMTNETRRIVVDGNTNDQIITEVDSVEENQATITGYIGDPSGNSTTLWDYIYCDTVNFNNINTCLFYRMWVLYSWRTTSGIQT